MDISTASNSGLTIFNDTHLRWNLSAVQNYTQATTHNDNLVKVVTYFALVPIIISIGMFGNISTIIVFYQQKQKHASNIFIIALALSDFLFLFFRFVCNIYYICQIFFTETLRNLVPNSFFWYYMSLLFQRNGNLLILAIVMERFTAVLFPFKLRQVWNKKLSSRVTVAILLFVLGDVVTIVETVKFSIRDRLPAHMKPFLDVEVARFRLNHQAFVWTWAGCYRIICDMLPLPLVCVFNIVIIFGMRRNASSNIALNTIVRQRKDQEAKITKMLLSISFLFVLLCGPFTILANIRILGLLSFDNTIITDFLHILNILNSVINFCMYGWRDKSLKSSYYRLWGCKKTSRLYSDSDIRNRFQMQRY